MVSHPELSAIQKLDQLQDLASVFHQDFTYDGGDFRTGAREHISYLTVDQRHLLCAQIESLLSKNLVQSEIRTLWRAMGADWLPKKIDIIEELKLILEDLKPI